MINYKETLNLPYTEFPMKANLPINEINILKFWYEDDLYGLIRVKKNGKKLFLLHDGPPYANGNIHLGHAVNKILKDIIIKFKNFSGYDAPYLPGWDCHGLPVELQVEQLIKKSGVHVNARKFRDICRKYVSEQIEIQKEDFIRLGVLGDWDCPYLTMNSKTEANIIRTLGKVISNGYVYKGFKPVYWCFRCCSTVANSEVEYRTHCSSALDVGFSIIDNNNINRIFNVNFSYLENIELIIWTTTPWTLPANQALSVHPGYIYQLIRVFNNKYIIIVSDLVHNFMKHISCCSWKILGETLGINLEYVRVRHPFMDYDVPVVLSRHITLDSGTGIVHIAPNHGSDDYLIAQKYKFKKIVNLINDEGYYLSNTHSKLDGLHVFKSNNIIVDLLIQSNNFLYIDYNYQHSYPYCCRHMFPLIFKVTSQWFLNMEHNNLRDKLLKIIQTVKCIPNTGRSSMESMITKRPDWCLSRQRVWGVPIPILINKTTELLHPRTSELIEKVAKLVEQNGIQVWWDLKIEDIIEYSESIYYKKVCDTLDVWFDSGSTYDSVISKEFQLMDHQLVDLYVEGLDQYRGWFLSSLIISVVINNRAPYKKILSHGFTIDCQGNKMSKSLGNTISPQEIINKFGSDILRLWIASSDYSKDMSVSEEVLKHVVDVYRRIRNTMRFCLANLNDFNPSINIIQSQDMIALDRWAIDHTLSTQLKIISDYEQYQFHNVVQHIMRFCSIEMGSCYLDIIKDRQYTLRKNSLARRSCQTTLYHILESMVRWIAPILSFTADEIWRYIPGRRSKYVFTEEWYDGLFKIDKYSIINSDYWNIFFNIRNQVNKIIEQARIDRIIKGSLEANIIIYATPILAKQLRILEHELSFGLLTASVLIVDDNFDISENEELEKFGKFKVVLEKSKGVKCLRCWNYTLNICQYKHYQNICARCIQNMFGSGEIRRFF